MAVLPRPPPGNVRRDRVAVGTVSWRRDRQVSRLVVALCRLAFTISGMLGNRWLLPAVLPLLLLGCSGASDEAVEAVEASPPAPQTRAEQLARLKILAEQSAAMEEAAASQPRLGPDLRRREGEADQDWYLRIFSAMRQARRLALRDDPQKALHHYAACLHALESLPPEFNRDIVALRQETCREQMGRLERQIAAKEGDGEDGEGSKRAEPPPAAESSAPEVLPAPLLGDFPAPTEGSRALFFETVEQVRTARRLEGQGRLRPALHEYEEALKKMKQLYPKLKHGDGGPDDEVRDAIRTIKRRMK